MSAIARFGSGQAVRRLEDPALVAGRGRYTDDLAPAGECHLVFLRSPHAHARIVSIDTAAAEAMPGVLGIHTGAQLVAAGVKPMLPAVPLKRPDGQPLATAPRRPLAHERVRFVGEAVAAVVAETREQAKAAAEAVFVDYEELPAVVEAEAAMRPGAPALCEAAPDNVSAAIRHGDAQAAERAFAGAAHVVALDLVNQRVSAVAMEPRTVLAEVEPGSGRLSIHSSNQMPTAVRDGIVAALPGLDAAAVRVQVGDVGGGFGMKGGPYPEDIVVAHAARQLGRPVKWRAERIEEFTSAAHGRDANSHAELALDANGKVLALRVRTLANIGAYASAVNLLIPLVIGPWVSTSVYDIAVIDLDLTAVMTNTSPVGAYRGAGRPEAIYIVERLMDVAARRLGLDPAELRRRNLIRPEQMPYRNPMAQTYDSGRFERALDRALVLADWAGFEARRAASERAGRLRGRGLVTFLEWTSGNAFEERVRVEVRGDGTIELASGVMGMGQGIATSLAQLAVDVFQVPIERIRILTGDTDRINGFGSAGSRSLYVGGSAVHAAAARTVDEAKTLAAEALEAPAADIEYREGRFAVGGTDFGIDLFELAGRQPERRIVVDMTHASKGPSWPSGCHVCEVEIDPATGAVAIAAYTSVNDIGRVVSPVLARGQIEGGVAQGVGQALVERIAYDSDSGQCLTATLMDYALPRIDGFIGLVTEFEQSSPSESNVLGAKGVGELGTIGATPVVVNAVADALVRAGRADEAERLQMPLTAERVWRALQGR